MAHWSKIDDDNIVENVIVTSNDEPDEGKAWIAANLEGRWIKTSYNTLAGVHLLGGTPLRKNFGQIGFTYDERLDAFIPPKDPELPSWVLDEDKCVWVPPIPYPSDGKVYVWDESLVQWVEVIITEVME